MVGASPMKLALRQEEGASVIDVTGAIDAHGLAVLKAGLTKLLQNGKNRIVVNVHDGEGLSNDIIRELAILDVFARELSGKIVLVSGSADLKSKVTTFAKPPVIAILPSVAKALSYLEDLDALEGDEGGESFAEVSRDLEAKTKQVAALEAQLKQATAGDAPRLRAENAALRDKVTMLESQIAELMGKPRRPVDASGFLEQIQALEEAVRRLGGEKAQGAKK